MNARGRARSFQVGDRALEVWRQRGHWRVTVDGVAVGGRHMTEAKAAGAGLLHAMHISGELFPPRGPRGGKAHRVTG